MRLDGYKLSRIECYRCREPATHVAVVTLEEPDQPDQLRIFGPDTLQLISLNAEPVANLLGVCTPCFTGLLEQSAEATILDADLISGPESSTPKN